MNNTTSMGSGSDELLSGWVEVVLKDIHSIFEVSNIINSMAPEKNYVLSETLPRSPPQLTFSLSGERKKKRRDAAAVSRVSR